MTLEKIDTQSGDIVLSEPTPVEKVAQAREWSTALMDVVNSRGLYTEQNGNKYLHVEAWELIGAFAGVRAETDSVEAISANDLIVGYQAKVVLVNTADGTKLGGGAIAMCGLDEFVTKGQKTQGAKHNSAMSMAQTRAVSKAFRMNFSYVAVLGGYAPTPAEEMPPEEKANPDSEHYCEKHGVEWFMKGKMKNYAHPIEGESGWCNMPKETLSPVAAPKEMTKDEVIANFEEEGWSREDIKDGLGMTLTTFLEAGNTPFAALEAMRARKQATEKQQAELI